MVNSKIIRGVGLVILAGCYVAVQQVFTKRVVGDTKSLFVTLIGGGRGSMYNTCADDSPTLKKLTSVNLVEKAPTDLKYNFYSLHNPKEYLGGSDAIMVEQGPYALRKHSVAYNVDQNPSALTEDANPDPKGNLEYSTANAYLVLDKDTKATTNLQRNDDRSINFSDSKATLPETKRALASHLSMSDNVVNYSPDYLSLLGTFNDEVNLILSLECTADQIMNIGVAGKAQCSGSGDSSDCACCMLDSDYKLATSRNTGVEPAYTKCNSFFDDEGTTMTMLSRLASHDGGIAVKSAGEKKYDGSGDLISGDFYTALIQEHTVNDLLFGYPSAFLGRVAFHAQMDQAKKSLSSPLSSVELSKRMLTGQMDSDLSFKLGDIAQYTSDVGSVCFATCLDGNGDCSGHAPERHELSDVDKIKLGGIDCTPYTSTYETTAKCAVINTVLSQDPNAVGYDACVCANGSDEWSSQGCCLAGGSNIGESLRGEGCLFEVAGIEDPNYAGMDTTIANAIDLGSALEAWIEKEASNVSSEFMCPAAGTGLDEHDIFGAYESHDGSTSHVTYYHTGNDRIRQADVTDDASTAFSTPVSGGSGKFFKPKGLTSKVGTSQISDGFPIDIAHPVFVPSGKKSIDFNFEGVRDNFVRNKVCGTDSCIVSARLIPANTTFHATNETDGAGLPFDGLQPVGHVSGPSINGRPEYLHQPLYVGGDEILYTQQDNSYVGRADGNGIKIYRSLTESDPGAFNPDTNATDSNYQLVDKAVVDSQSKALLSHVDIEVASGLGARQRMRFGTSYSIWECDPATNEKCKLALNAQAQYSCYSGTGSTVFNDLAAADKSDLETLGLNNFTYPCSAANLLTPSVVGGKILPSFWVEESTAHASKTEIDLLAAYAKAYSKNGNTFILTVSLVFVSLFLGFSMLLRCLCFEQKSNFMEMEKPAASTASTSKSGGGMA
eukprot:CAMPEP_0201714314 /NCGR_PEP_ID=MMETSP0593-20130828/849_1 /ASSEMBLY_ACC=CAM_ASM_000672 /TAXON_ID=267983 /ORGANISM="Skeletonema japonicum, Strain CCMP2506" /LENGTH=947 /DNA_ID=CAMNT_0048203583 /DNA_START=104 /DNA_END=2947 /DNA_ORIENTATION=+